MIQNGTYTIENTETEEYRTFQVKTVQKGGLEGKRIIALLRGPSNESDYTGFAFLNETGIAIWKRFRSTQYEKLGHMLWAAMNGKLPERYRMMHSGTCIKCNRKLTTPESIKSGIGPICAGKEG
jgi:hypothetical protein